VLITGASGAGTTTLGRAVADRWSVPHADVDDYFWLPTTPPYTDKRPVEERVRPMSELFPPRPSWVLSGSLMEWGDSVAAMCEGIVFLTLDAEARMRRLGEREAIRYSALDDNAHRAFMDWARGYDDPSFEGRNRARHESWLETTGRPVLRLDSDVSVLGLVGAVDRWLR
jgi:hypothetical protein